MSDGLYDRLAAPFEVVHTDTRGGVTFDYLTGEQVAARLNEVLGPGGWSFKVLHQELHAEADEWWVLGQLTATFPFDITREQTVVREQYGSQKIRRSRATSQPLDTGFDLKAAATDAMKKAASLIGVGLYLSHKEGKAPKRQPSTTHPAVPAGPVIGGGNSIPPEHRAAYSARTAPIAPPPDIMTPDIFCQECGQLVEPVDRRDGSGKMTAREVADRGMLAFERELCGDCLKVAMAARAALGGKRA